MALINMATGARRDEIADADGFFQFRDVGAGTYRLVFTAPGRNGHISHYFTLEAVNDGYHYDATLQNGTQQRVLMVRVVSPYFIGQYQPGMQVFLGADVPANQLTQPTDNHFWHMNRTTGAGEAGGIGIVTATLPGFDDAMILVQAGHYINNVAVITLPMGGVHLLPGTIMGNIWGLPVGGLPGDEVELPGASITLINQQTLQRFNTISNHSGFFRFDGLLPGTYSIFVSAEGYMPRALHEVVLLEGAGVFIDIILAPGALPPTLFAIVQSTDPDNVISIEASDSRFLTRQASTDIWYIENADNTFTLYGIADGYVQVGTAEVDSVIYTTHGILFAIVVFEPEILPAEFTFHKVNMEMTRHVRPEDPLTWGEIDRFLLSGAHFGLFRYTGDTPLGANELVPLGQFDDALGNFPANVPWELVWYGVSTDTLPMETGIDTRFTYHLVELIAPRGFSPPHGQWRIWYGPDAGGSLEFGIQTQGIADSMLPPIIEIDGIFYVGNREEFLLPITGGLGARSGPLVLGASIIVIAMGLGVWFLLRGRVTTLKQPTFSKVYTLKPRQ